MTKQANDFGYSVETIYRSESPQNLGLVTASGRPSKKLHHCKIVRFVDAQGEESLELYRIEKSGLEIFVRYL